MRWAEVRAVTAWLFAGVSVVVLLAAILISLNTMANATQQINAERERNIRAACEAQNKRNHNTIQQLDALIAKAPPERRERAAASRPGTVLLINALAPRRDCEALVRSQIDASSP